MEFTTKWSLWGLRVIIFFIWFLCLTLLLPTWIESLHPHSLGLRTVGTGDLGWEPNLALGYF